MNRIVHTRNFVKRCTCSNVLNRHTRTYLSKYVMNVYIQSFIECCNTNFVTGKCFNINTKNRSWCEVNRNHTSQVSKCTNFYTANFFVNNRRPCAQWYKRSNVGNSSTSNIELKCVDFSVWIGKCNIEISLYGIHIRYTNNCCL